MGRRIAAGTLLALIAIVGWRDGPVSAHAVVVDVSPPADAVVDTVPDEVLITFSENVSLRGGSAVVFDDTGAAIPVEAKAVDRAVRIELPDDLDDGTYLVAWRVISDDSHPVTGTSFFSIGAPSTVAPDAADVGDGLPAAVALWRVLAMAVAYGGVLVTVGSVWFARRWRSSGMPVDRVDRMVTAAVIAGLVGLVAAIPARLVTVGGGWSTLGDGGFVGDILTGPVGQAAAVTAVGVVGLWFWHRTAPGRPSGLVGVVLSLLALGGFVIEGHTRTKTPTWLMVTSNLVHLGSGATWLGGVAILGLLIKRTAGLDRARLAFDVSGAALWAVAAVSITGVTMSVLVLPSFNALADTGYGLALMVKVALVVVLLAFGARNRLLLVPNLRSEAQRSDQIEADAATGALWRSVRLELGVFALVLVATAVLVGRSPIVYSDTAAGSAADVAPTGPVTGTVSIPLSSGAGVAIVSLDPGRVGPNTFTLTLASDDGSPLALVEPPTVELRERSRGIGPLPLDPGEAIDGVFTIPTDIPFAGAWEISVSARTSTFDSGLATADFTVDG